MDESEVVEHFYGVYLLYCMNPKYRGRTYIGYTVDPKRRIKQHNAGKDQGGAWKTSNRGPWNMVLIIHGFPNSTSALRFEWAWQHPQVSRRLKHVAKKKSNQKAFDYCLSVASEMLNVGPWRRLPLTIRWLDYDFFQEYSSRISPPMHMPICCGQVASQKIKRTNDILKMLDESSVICSICNSLLDDKDSVRCIRSTCSLVAHLICLAQLFCKDNMILPIEGTCPCCNVDILWGDLIRKKIGCYGDLQDDNETA